MEKISRKIILYTPKSGTTNNINKIGYISGITESDFNLVVCLQQSHQNLGYYQSIPKDSNINGLEKVIPVNGGTNVIPNVKNGFLNRIYTVTGETESKLDLVKSSDPLQPYKVGLNGVTQVTLQTVKYTIDSINFITYLDINKTIYSFAGEGITSKNFTNNNVVLFNEINHGFLEVFRTDSDVNINRNNVSAFDMHVRLTNITSLGSLIAYGGSFFNIIKN